MMDAPVGLCLVAADGRVLEVNESLCDFLGRDVETLRVPTWADVTHPDDAPWDRTQAMRDVTVPERVTATPAARSALAALRAARGGEVMFVQSGGCCAGSTPMCFADGEFVVGDVDLLLGDIDGSPFYIDRRLDEAWNQTLFVLDVEPGPPEDFSLAAGDDLQSVTRSAGCATPSIPAHDPNGRNAMH